MLRNVDIDAARTRFSGLYSGTVADVEDPDSVGRISVNVPSVFDGDSPDFTVWARPCLPYGHFFVPEVGDQVWIAFEHGDPSAPVWIGTWYPQDGVPAEAEASPPTKRLIHSPTGHYILLDDDEGKVLVVDSNGNSIAMNSDGLALEDSNGNTATMDSSGIALNDKNGNSAVMESGGITLTDVAGTTLELTSMKIWLEGFVAAVSAAPIVPTDGGASFKTALSTYFGTNSVPM